MLRIVQYCEFTGPYTTDYTLSNNKVEVDTNDDEVEVDEEQDTAMNNDLDSGKDASSHLKDAFAALGQSDGNSLTVNGFRPLRKCVFKVFIDFAGMWGDESTTLVSELMKI